MTDQEWQQLTAAVGEGRGFPSRETGAHAVGDPERWEKLYLRIAALDRMDADSANFVRVAALNALCALAEERHFCDRVIAGVRKDEERITQALGKVLGYPEAYPEVSEVNDGSVVTEPHVAATIALEAAEQIQTLQGQVTRWATWHARRSDADRFLASPPQKTILKCYYGADTDRVVWEVNEQVGMPIETHWGAGLAYGYPIAATWVHQDFAPQSEYDGEVRVHMASVLHGVQPLDEPTPAPARAKGPTPFGIDDPRPFSYRVSSEPPGDPELAAAPEGSYRDKFTGELITPDDDRWVPF